MSFWNGKKPPPLPSKHPRMSLSKLLDQKTDEEYDNEDNDLLYVLEKKVNAILQDKEREISMLKAQIHDNAQFLQQIILELISKGTVGTSIVRSSSVPIGNSGNVNTKSVKELVQDAKTQAGPIGRLP